MRYIVPFLLLWALLGCSTPTQQAQPQVSVTPSGAALPEMSRGTRLDMEGQFFLSSTQRDHPHARVRLVSVGHQGGTVIQHLDTQSYAQAAPGEFFVCDEFGTNRLKLLSASQTAQEAWFTYKWTEWR